MHVHAICTYPHTCTEYTGVLLLADTRVHAHIHTHGLGAAMAVGWTKDQYLEGLCFKKKCLYLEFKNS